MKILVESQSTLVRGCVGNCPWATGGCGANCPQLQCGVKL